MRVEDNLVFESVNLSGAQLECILCEVPGRGVEVEALSERLSPLPRS